jgi:hypothetical protein
LIEVDLFWAVATISSSSSSCIPVSLTWRRGHPRNTLFHFSFLIHDSSWTHWTGDQPFAKQLPNTNTHIHVLSGRRHFMPQTARPLWLGGQLFKGFILKYSWSQEQIYRNFLTA